MTARHALCYVVQLQHGEQLARQIASWVGVGGLLLFADTFMSKDAADVDA